ncbi:hypothetical protein CK203_026460 [Vitis vinifera]|uniref:Retrovirus-related Pol polyprotein from transposon TNT 1-94 n=1 Tax=Vitis vinifera TaxID=29760 RepID=A0A438IVM9_VITVI|nr:hypothetical protein CK203_026460 [Vitis vinifera]
MQRPSGANGSAIPGTSGGVVQAPVEAPSKRQWGHRLGASGAVVQAAFSAVQSAVQPTPLRDASGRGFRRRSGGALQAAPLRHGSGTTVEVQFRCVGTPLEARWSAIWRRARARPLPASLTTPLPALERHGGALALCHRDVAAVQVLWLQTTLASSISANVNNIPVLNGTNFKKWKEHVIIVLGCMDLEFALREDRPLDLTSANTAEQREYIMEMSNLVTRLKALKLELSEDILVHLVLISLPTQFKEERLKQEKIESAHLASTSQGFGTNKKRKRDNKGKQTAVSGTSKQKEQKKQDKEITCFFCQEGWSYEETCTKYAAWREKKGTLLNFVCSEINLAVVPTDTWWIDTGATTHISVTMQGCLRSRMPTDGERYIYVGNGNKAAVKAIGLFRLQLDSG